MVLTQTEQGSWASFALVPGKSCRFLLGHWSSLITGLRAWAELEAWLGGERLGLQVRSGGLGVELWGVELGA